VIANVTAKPYGPDDDMRELLVRQVVSCVRWQETIESIEGMGVSALVEMGHGSVLSTIYQSDRKNRKLAFVRAEAPSLPEYA
jgi:[acyl-carrier-protein] S-malonyltransferase